MAETLEDVLKRLYRAGINAGVDLHIKVGTAPPSHIAVWLLQGGSVVEGRDFSGSEPSGAMAYYLSEAADRLYGKAAHEEATF